MIRRVAEIYGGRSGTLGSWRLTRAVMTHLVATGAVAIGDDLIGSVAGGSVLKELAKFVENQKEARVLRPLSHRGCDVPELVLNAIGQSVDDLVRPPIVSSDLMDPADKSVSYSIFDRASLTDNQYG